PASINGRGQAPQAARTVTRCPRGAFWLHSRKRCSAIFSLEVGATRKRWVGRHAIRFPGAHTSTRVQLHEPRRVAACRAERRLADLLRLAKPRVQPAPALAAARDGGAG